MLLDHAKEEERFALPDAGIEYTEIPNSFLDGLSIVVIRKWCKIINSWRNWNHLLEKSDVENMGRLEKAGQMKNLFLAQARISDILRYR